MTQAYLRNRYYDPNIGRFVTEDPARDGANWYVYCENSPIKYQDPTGLFGQNTKLSYNQNHNPDVVKMQRQLVSLGYLDMSDGKGWGYSGPKTQSAVNQYKDDQGLRNSREYKGVVGATTWKHMGLKIDNYYENGGYTGTPESYGKGIYVEATGFSLDRGITIGNAQVGIGKIGGDYRYGSWEIQTVTADAAAGLSLDYVGANLEGRLVKAEGGFKIPIPFTNKSLFIGGEGSLFAVGFHSYYDKKDGTIKIGASALVGVGIILGIGD